MNSHVLHLTGAVKNTFEQITGILQELSDEEYGMPGSLLLNASIGQHVRHIIELFIELEKGYANGTVNYEQRKRDHRIETDKYFAASLLNEILKNVVKENKPLLLEAGFNSNTEESIQMQTNYYRELAYNIEHTIHHMALIRVSVNQLSVKVKDDFGIASATIKYRKACAQ